MLLKIFGEQFKSTIIHFSITAKNKIDFLKTGLT